MLCALLNLLETVKCKLFIYLFIFWIGKRGSGAGH